MSKAEYLTIWRVKGTHRGEECSCGGDTRAVRWLYSCMRRFARQERGWILILMVQFLWSDWYDCRSAAVAVDYDKWLLLCKVNSTHSYRAARLKSYDSTAPICRHGSRTVIYSILYWVRSVCLVYIIDDSKLIKLVCHHLSVFNPKHHQYKDAYRHTYEKTNGNRISF